ncbi:hypothetical protein AAC03nite_37270 [Alicyclobacillus acidoterrestris]|nr:hypothetical protein AAC03nite_37270 [Alicyclobacillus acidoterrestris]
MQSDGVNNITGCNNASTIMHDNRFTIDLSQLNNEMQINIHSLSDVRNRMFCS